MASEYLREWVEQKKPDLKHLTFASYKMIVEKHLIPFFGNTLLLKDIEPYHINEYKTHKLQDGRVNREGGLSNRTVQYHMRILSQALSAAVILELIPKNPADNIPAPKVSRKKQKKKITILTPEQMRLFLAKGKEHPDFDCWYFSIFTGVRRGEMLGLRFQDINWAEKIAKIEQAVLEDGNGGIHWDTEDSLKNESSEAFVPLTDGVIEMLKRRKKEVAKNKLLLGENYNDHDLVFCKPDGNQPDTPFDSL